MNHTEYLLGFKTREFRSQIVFAAFGKNLLSIVFSKIFIGTTISTGYFEKLLNDKFSKLVLENKVI